jgi:hypothetical protein
LANASKHAAVSYKRAGEIIQELDLEIEALLGKAEEADAKPLEDGLSIPKEIQRREERKAMLAKARAEMEARAYASAQAEQAAYQAKMEKREEKRKSGKKPRGKEPKPPSQAPQPKDQYNFSDPTSRIMKAGSGNHFEQSYNAQGALEVESRLMVGARVSDAPNDKEELPASLQAVEPVVGSVGQVLIDSGFVSEAAINAVEKDRDGNPTATTVFAAIKRERHGRTVAQLEKKEDPLPPEQGASFTEKIAHRVATKAGRALYKLRQQTIEPVFGIIKETMGFRRFSLRGLQKVSLEWSLVTLAYNFKRLFIMKAQLHAA